MRAHVSLIGIAALALFPYAAQAQPAPGSCEAKKADIARDIDEAKARGQTHRVRGLETALRETRANCSDAKLAREHEAKVKRQERKVVERERELEKARAEGKPDKIASRQAKLAEEEAELHRLVTGAR